MSKILTDFSENIITEVIELNMYASTPFFYDWPGAETYEGEDISWCITDIPAPSSNVIFRPRLKHENVDSVLNQIKTKGNEKNVGLLCWVSGNCSPHNIGDRLIEHDFLHVGSIKGMAVDLDIVEDIESPLSSLTISEISDKENLKDWSSIATTGFGFPIHVEPALFLWANRFASIEAPVKFYLAKIDDKPVATSMIVFSHGVAGLYYISTLPDYRYRGIGYAITLKTLQEAKKDGYRISVLQASDMGEPVYRKLGFKDYSSISSYVWLNDSHRNVIEN